VTGHKGERSNRAVALVTDDFRSTTASSRSWSRTASTCSACAPPTRSQPPCRCSSAARQRPAQPAAARRPGGDAALRAPAPRPQARPRRLQAHRARRRPGQGHRPRRVADGKWLLVGESLSVEAAVERLAAWALGLAAPTSRSTSAPAPPRRPRPAGPPRPPPARREGVAGARGGHDAGQPVTGSRHTDAAVHIAMREPL